MTQRPTTSIVLDNHIKQNNKFNVKLRVTFNRKPKYYSTGIDLTKDQFGERSTNRRLKKENIRLNEIEQKAIEIIDTLNPFSFEAFNQRLLNKSSKGTDVYRLFEKRVEDLLQENRIGNARIYEGAMKSLKKFKSELHFEQVTPSFLKNYQDWYVKQGRKITTVGINLRHLRAIYNLAIQQEIVKPESNPFGRHKYIIPKGLNTKKALTLEEIALMFDYVPKSEWEKKSIDFWKFGYFSSGMNLVDILRLRISNMEENSFSYIRKKTQGTKNSTEQITVPLSDETIQIIKRWGKLDGYKDDYVFPVLRPFDSPKMEYYRVTEFRRHVNENTKRIAKTLGIRGSVTTYVARHSFASVLYHSNVNIGLIQNSMGHSSLAMTQQYLSGFDISAKREVQSLLLPTRLKAV